MFLYLLKHAALYFPEGAFIPHEGNATLKKTEGNRGEQIDAGITYDLKSGEESAVEAGENFFIDFITGTIEEIKMVPTIMTDVQATTAQNYLTQ